MMSIALLSMRVKKYGFTDARSVVVEIRLQPIKSQFGEVYIMDKYTNEMIEKMQSDKLENCFDYIRTTISSKNKRIQHLEDVIGKLRSETYKDKELQRMQEELEKMRANYLRGFPITEEEQKAIKEWHLNHYKEVHAIKTAGSIGGNVEYIFTPTTIGVLGEVKCSCGAKFCFSDL